MAYATSDEPMIDTTCVYSCAQSKLHMLLENRVILQRINSFIKLNAPPAKAVTVTDWIVVC